MSKRIKINRKFENLIIESIVELVKQGEINHAIKLAEEISLLYNDENNNTKDDFSEEIKLIEADLLLNNNDMDEIRNPFRRRLYENSERKIQPIFGKRIKQNDMVKMNIHGNLLSENECRERKLVIDELNNMILNNMIEDIKEGLYKNESKEKPVRGGIKLTKEDKPGRDYLKISEDDKPVRGGIKLAEPFRIVSLFGDDDNTKDKESDTNCCDLEEYEGQINKFIDLVTKKF